MLTIIFVCPTDRLPTHCRQVANRSPTVGRESANTLASNITQTVGRLSADCWPTVGRLSADSWPTVGRLSADCRPTVGRQYNLGTILPFTPGSNAINDILVAILTDISGRSASILVGCRWTLVDSRPVYLLSVDRGHVLKPKTTKRNH